MTESVAIEQLREETRSSSFFGGLSMAKLASGLMYAAMIGLIFLAAATVVDIGGRKLFEGFSVRGIYELSSLFMAVIISMVMASAFLQRRNLTLDLFLGIMGDGSVLRLVSSALEVAFLSIVAWQIYLRGVDAAEFNETTSLLEVPIAPFWYVTSFTLGFAAVALIWQTLRGLGALRYASRAQVVRAIIALLVTATITVSLVWLVAANDLSPGWRALAAFATLYLLLLTGQPIGIGLGLSGFVFLLVGIGSRQAFAVVGSESIKALSSNSLSAIPLFMLMGAFAVRAGMARDIFAAASALTAGLRGGLPVASILGCAAFGAISGSSIATTATFGKVAFGEMKARGYNTALATGSLAAGGTLGALIPPSVVLIIYCVLVEVSILDAFMAALIPGILAAALYVVAIIVSVRLRPDLCPAPSGFDAKTFVSALVSAWRPVLLFTIVLSGLYGGVFTTQEAAAVGAVLALVFAMFSPDFTLQGLWDSFAEAALNSAVIYIVVAGANMFAAYLTMTDITTTVLSVVDVNATPHWLILLCIVIMYLILGSVFDTMAAVLVTAPFIIPLVTAMGYDLIWWGIVTLSLVEIGMITPPIGMNVFVMQSVIAREVPLSTIFRGTIPFLMADALRLLLLILFPIITLWLPGVL
jgi:tripartite ATP-independent transporter DctM subunit